MCLECHQRTVRGEGHTSLQAHFNLCKYIHFKTFLDPTTPLEPLLSTHLNAFEGYSFLECLFCHLSRIVSVITCYLGIFLSQKIQFNPFFLTLLFLYVSNISIFERQFTYFFLVTLRKHTCSFNHAFL